MLRDRLLVAFPLVVLTAAAFCLPGWAGGVLFLVLLAAFGLLAGIEFFSLSAASGQPGHPLLTLGFGILFLLVSCCSSAPLSGSGVLVMSLFVGACFIACLRAGAPTLKGLQRVWVSMGGFLYIYWCLSYLCKLYFVGPGIQGRFMLLYVVAVTKAADVGAYTAGTLTAQRPGGNHKLVPKISPKKSWEGLLGGIIFSVFVSLLLVGLVGDRMLAQEAPLIGIPLAIVFGVLAPFVGLLGDLTESALKRVAKAKDSGFLPGLGGALDILDSLIPAAPLFYAFWAFATGA